MKYRISNIIQTLRRVPPPSYEGEERFFPILQETWEHEWDLKYNARSIPIKGLKLIAKSFNDGDINRLEWTYEI